MKRGTLISIIIALIAVGGALLGLVAYMRSRRCLECGGVEEDYIPDVEGDYDMEYYVDDQPESVQPVEETVSYAAGYVSTPVSADDTEDDDITE
ncbi:hypothetical protein [Hydrogenoanaerobacterium sp.]|uniref:hypothetical protein n=1 Tax=Hydrogenoanaerobacterium sp. TaxID=2953763 RepID=UPI002897D42D|nr:hypothetical protein [Hydrogenoanaerobacterium sp.]